MVICSNLLLMLQTQWVKGCIQEILLEFDIIIYYSKIQPSLKLKIVLNRMSVKKN
jgi:hypothetical protein